MKIYRRFEVARLLDVSPNTVRKWEVAGKLRSYTLPLTRESRFTEKALRQFIEAHMPELLPSLDGPGPAPPRPEGRP